MDQDQLHNVVHKISKFNIILPIVIIMLGILLKPEAPKNITYTKTVALSPIPSLAPTNIIPTVSHPTKVPGTPINLQGPQVCNFHDDQNFSGSIFIKNKQVYGELLEKKTNIKSKLLLQGDCVYKWSTEIVSANKMCGLSKYISVFDSMASVNLLTAEDLINTLAEYGRNTKLQNLVTQCTKEQISDAKYKLPANIKFQEVQAPIPPSN